MLKSTPRFISVIVDSSMEKLSPRMLESLRLFNRGLPRKVAAEKMNISVGSLTLDGFSGKLPN